MKELVRTWLLILLVVVYFIGLAILTSGCASVGDFLFPEALDRDAKVSWKHDLKMKINGVSYRGLALVPKAQNYEIKIYPPTNEIDRLLWSTCHRGESKDKAVEDGFWPWSKKDEYFKFVFTPAEEELKRSCPLRFQAFEKKHRNISFGLVAFPDHRQEAILPATTHCNGVIEKTIGKNICQAPINSLQRIDFIEPVLATAASDSNCEAPKGDSPGTIFYIHPSKDECIYIFQSKEKHPQNGRRLMFSWHVYGWEKLPPPEEK